MLESRVPVSKVACGSCSLFPKRPMPWYGKITLASDVFLLNSANARGAIGGVSHLPLASSKLKWLQSSWSGSSRPRMLVIEGGQYFSFPGIVISSYFGFSSSFWITNNPKMSIIKRSSRRVFGLCPFSDVRQKVPTGSFLHLSDTIHGIVSGIDK